MRPEEQQAFNQSQVGFNQAQGSLAETQRSLMLEEQDKGMIREQLDLGEELEKIENLLRGRVLVDDGNGGRKWSDPDDPELVILNEYGIQLILNTITWYINKNTLLSNYEDKLILEKMEDFALALADRVFMNYEKVFKYPSEKECQEVLKDRLEKKANHRVFELELHGKKGNYKEIFNNFLEELDVDVEITKIREQIIKNKLKGFELLIRVVQDAVHSTYLRAKHGQERRSLRQHMHVSESSGSNLPQQQKGGLFSWIKR